MGREWIEWDIMDYSGSWLYFSRNNKFSYESESYGEWIMWIQNNKRWILCADQNGSFDDDFTTRLRVSSNFFFF